MKTEDEKEKIDKNKFFKSHFEIMVFLEYFFYHLVFYFFLGPIIGILF